MGEAYWFGEGVKVDSAEAVKWFRKAAIQDHAKAQYCLADAYARGVGVEVDIDEAKKWMRYAAKQGYPEAQFRVG